MMANNITRHNSIVRIDNVRVKAKYRLTVPAVLVMCSKIQGPLPAFVGVAGVWKTHSLF